MRARTRATAFISQRVKTCTCAYKRVQHYKKVDKKNVRFNAYYLLFLFRDDLGLFFFLFKEEEVFFFFSSRLRESMEERLRVVVFVIVVFIFFFVVQQQQQQQQQKEFRRTNTLFSRPRVALVAPGPAAVGVGYRVCREER